MTAVPPSPKTTLVILLGASRWPFSPEFQASKAFLNSAMELRAYFLNPSQFGLPQENLLNLFNSNQSADDIDGEIGLFLEKRMAEMKQAGETARDLIVYFVGHGGFVGDDSDFYLAIRRTRTDNPGASGIQMESLAYTLKEKARYLRRIVILDCCFAGAAFSAFQAAGPAQVAIVKTVDAFGMQGKGTGLPERGTSLLCSSRHTAPSLISQDGTHTLFSQALCRALSAGNPQRQDALSLRAIADLTEDVLSLMPEKSVPRPEVHSPDQVDGDVADVPFFPNPAARSAKASIALFTESLIPTEVVMSLEQSFAPIVHTSEQVSQPQQPPVISSGVSPSDTTIASSYVESGQHPYISPNPYAVNPYAAPPPPPRRRRLSAEKIVLLIVLVLLIVGAGSALYLRAAPLSGQPQPHASPTTQAPQVAATPSTQTPQDLYAQITQGTPALDDPLSDNSRGYNWSEFREAAHSCVFTQGAYHVKDLQNTITPYCTAYTNPTFRNFAYQVQLTIVKGDAGGIIFREDTDITKGNFYLFGIGQNGQYGLFIYKNYSPVAKLRFGSSPAINAGLSQSNLLAVVASGSTIGLYVNKQKIGSVSDNSYSQGYIGVFAEDQNSPTEVVFSNAKVWEV